MEKRQLEKRQLEKRQLEKRQLEKRRLRIVQAGVGGMGKTWVGVLKGSPDFDVAAMADPNADALAKAGEALGVPESRRFADLDAALNALGDGNDKPDAVLTVTPPAVHVEHARLAFGRGLHLLTEKPMAGTLADAVEMRRLAESAGRQLVVAQNYRYRPATETLRRLIAEQAAGPLGHGHVDFYKPADFTGSFRESMRHVLLVDMCVHHFDLVRFVTGRDITRVYAQTFRPGWSWYEHHPGLKAVFDLGPAADGTGGPSIPFSYSGDWSARGRNTDWNGTWRLQCEAGSIGYDNGKITQSRSERGFTDDVHTAPVAPDAPPLTEQSAVLASFAASIRTGTPAPTSGADNLQTFAAVMAAVRSAEEGRAVELAEVLAGG